MIFTRAEERLADLEPARVHGRVQKASGLVVQCEGLAVPVGALCEVCTAGGGRVRCEVVGFTGGTSLLMPLGELQGIRSGDRVNVLAMEQRVPVGDALLGRVIDALGNPLDGGPPVAGGRRRPLTGPAPQPLSRARILEPLATGVRAIDALHTCGRGQRIGLFSGSGVGKSTLLGMCARHTAADVIVIALVGERGREVREFVERELGPEGLARSVVVVETSERPALLRVKAPFTATAVAEHFRDAGADVLFLMDSLTRMADAQREIGLSVNEPPATRGYPPSVFAQLPRLLERAGRAARGSITGVYAALVEGDDMSDPVADAARSILDGHIWLSRDLANRGHYPAVDPLQSISRLMIDVAPPEQLQAAARVRSLLSIHRRSEDLIDVGAYADGANPEIDLAVRAHGAIMDFLRQEIGERAAMDETRRGLVGLMKGFERDAGKAPAGGRE